MIFIYTKLFLNLLLNISLSFYCRQNIKFYQYNVTLIRGVMNYKKFLVINWKWSGTNGNKMYRAFFFLSFSLFKAKEGKKRKKSYISRLIKCLSRPFCKLANHNIKVKNQTSKYPKNEWNKDAPEYSFLFKTKINFDPKKYSAASFFASVIF